MTRLKRRFDKDAIQAGNKQLGNETKLGMEDLTYPGRTISP